MTVSPNVYETPLSFSPQLDWPFSGSDHSKSHRSPSSGTSVGLVICYNCETVTSSGDKPPCMQRILSSIKAAIGMQLNTS